MQENMSQYFGMMIAELTKWREEGKTRRVGRPKKEDQEVVYYPSPDTKHGNRYPYTKDELEAYYMFHKEPMPPLPEPLTKEELLKWEL